MTQDTKELSEMEGGMVALMVMVVILLFLLIFFCFMPYIREQLRYFVRKFPRPCILSSYHTFLPRKYVDSISLFLQKSDCVVSGEQSIGRTRPMIPDGTRTTSSLVPSLPEVVTRKKYLYIQSHYKTQTHIRLP